MWKTKGAVRYFLSILAMTFVQMGVFIYAQKILSGSFTDVESGQTWQAFMLQIFFLAPYILMVFFAGFFTNRFSKNKVLAWSALFMTVFVIAQSVLVTCNCPRVAFWLSIGLSCGFAVHSAAKYGILKEMFGVRNLSYANAFLQIFGLGGIVCASWLAVVGVNLINLESLQSYAAVHFLTSKSIVIPWISWPCGTALPSWNFHASTYPGRCLRAWFLRCWPWEPKPWNCPKTAQKQIS